MNSVIFSFFALFMLPVGYSCAQESRCDSIYTHIDESPAYVGGAAALMDYTGNRMAEVINGCEGANKEMSGKVLVIVTIDTNGKVVDVALSRHQLKKTCEEQLKAKLLTMTGWSPGKLNGQPVCCTYGIMISCIKWG